MTTRRQVLQGVLASALVVGFDPVHRRWVTAGAATPADFDAAPPLEGVLLLDAAAREAVATDKGNLVRHLPGAVLRPGSAADIAAMVRYCRSRAIPVAVRGQAHTTHGQGLCDGLIIENQYLDTIHSIGPSSAVVDTGVLWMDLLNAAYARKLTPPALTGYTQLTVGGTLSVGGIGGLVGGLGSGFQVDHVRALQVVTGAGDIVECSPSQRSDLFDAALGGLGQCGIMTRATIDLVPAKERARTYALHYTDNAAFFRDLRVLIERPGIDHVYTQWFPPGSTTLVYQLNATVFYDPLSPPNDLALTGGLSTAPVIQDQAYLDYAFLIDQVIDAMRTAADWDRKVKPWFDVFLPDSTAEQFLAEVLPTVTHRDIGSTGFVLLFPQRRALHARSLPRLPAADGSPWVFLFDILTVGDTTDADRDAFVSEMLHRNRRLYQRARDAFGGVRYPIGAQAFSRQDWVGHFGEDWRRFEKAKRKYDPDGILAPGSGIFG